MDFKGWKNKFLNIKTRKQNNYIKKSQIFYSRSSRKLKNFSKVFYNKGNIEFLIFSCVVGLGCFYIHKNQEKYGESTKLAAAGITTHVLVDVFTYSLDKLNTKAKIDYFYTKKHIESGVKSIDYHFNKKYGFFKSAFTPKKKKNAFDLENSLKKMRNKLELRGIQSAMVFLVFNSAVFYGLYKNLKRFLSENFHIEV